MAFKFKDLLDELCDENGFKISVHYIGERRSKDGLIDEEGYDIFRPATEADTYKNQYITSDDLVIHCLRYWPALEQFECFTKRDEIRMDLRDPESLSKLVKYISGEVDGSAYVPSFQDSFEEGP